MRNGENSVFGRFDSEIGLSGLSLKKKNRPKAVCLNLVSYECLRVEDNAGGTYAILNRIVYLALIACR